MTTKTIDEVGLLTLVGELMSRLSADVLKDETLDEMVAGAIKDAGMMHDDDGDYIHRSSGKYVTKSEMRDAIADTVAIWVVYTDPNQVTE